MTGTEPKSANRNARWLRILLFVSLALNLLIVGIAIGSKISGKDRYASARATVPIGAYGRALSHQDRRALSREFRIRARAMNLPVARQPERGAPAVIAALREEPFDPERLKAALGAERDRGVAAFELARTLLVEHLVSMSAAERQDYAARLSELLSRAPRER